MLCIFSCESSNSSTPETNTATEKSSASVFFIGHSLIGFDMPKMVNDISLGFEKTHSYDLQIANGSPLKWNWDQ